jgi:hypothetical protein
MTYVLWMVQVLLTLLFVFTGGTKLVLPLEVLTEQTPLSGWFVRFLGVAEVLGAVGLILTGLVASGRVARRCPPYGLVVIMAGATVLALAEVVPGGGLAQR